MTVQEKNFVLDGMVRDFCQLGKCPKSEVRRRIAEYTTAAAKEAREETIRECAGIADGIYWSAPATTDPANTIYNGWNDACNQIEKAILALLEKQ